MTRPIRLALILLTFGLAGCAAQNEDLSRPEPLGNFLLGHNIVVDEGAEVGPLSRTAEPEEWKTAITEAIDARFSPYDGDKYYHIAIKVEGYILAVPGVPLVASPKSALIFTATVWDDEAGAPINEEPEQFTVFESVSPETLLSSGLTRSREQQIEDLSRNAARTVHKWMLQNIEWFGGPGASPATISEGAVPAPETGPLTVVPVARPTDT